MTGPDSPWRQPMVWLIVALPLGSIVASAILITMALRSGGDDAVADRVQRTAQIQVRDLQPDLQARAMNLTAVIRLDREFVEVLPVTGDFDRRSDLRLYLYHPTHSGEDLSLRLLPTPLGWRVDRKVETSHAWRVRVAAADASWRIHGRLPKGQRAIHLAPALAAP